MCLQSVAVTGGNGTIGRYLLRELNGHGYRTANLNRGSKTHDLADSYVRCDLLDPGDVYGALAAVEPDAVVHLGMIPSPTESPEHVTFESNALSPYIVLEAAEALGVESAALASSLSALGAGFESDPVSLEYLPLDEAHPLRPSNPYGMGKQALELVADGFARRGSFARILSFRFPWCPTPEDQRETFVEADRDVVAIREAGHLQTARNTLFSYCDVRDVARAVRLALESDVTGHEALYLSAADTTTTTPTSELVREVYDVPVDGDLEGRAALVDTEKARALLGWEPDHSWRDLA